MKQHLTIVVLVLLTVGSFLLLRDLEKSLEPTEENKESREIAIAYQVKGLYYGGDNQLKYDIQSDSVTEYSNLAGTKINSPTVQVFDAEQHLSWQGRANVALLSADKDTLELDGQVRIVESPNSEKTIHASSEKMLYYADKREVTSDQPVLIETAMLKQTANNFRLDIDEKKIYFDGLIKGNYSSVSQSE